MSSPSGELHIQAVSHISQGLSMAEPVGHLESPVVDQAQDSSSLAAWIREFYSMSLDENGRAFVATIGLALLGVLILKSAYSLIKTSWPETYTDIETRAQEHIRVNPIRTYVIFRGGPVFLVSLFISVCTDRADGMTWLGFWLMVVIYLTWTTGRAVSEIFRTPRHPNWTMLLIYHILSVVVVVISGVLAVLLRSLFAPIIPANQELLISVWAGVFAALLAGVVRQLLAPHRLEGEEIVFALRKDIGSNTWSYLRKQAAGNEDLQNFIIAFVLAESQQRPRWFRRLERIGGKIWGSGTYGVAQIAADHPIKDRESIDQLVVKINNNRVQSALEEGVNSEPFYQICADLNNDPSHASRIRDFYETVRQMRSAGTFPE